MSITNGLDAVYLVPVIGVLVAIVAYESVGLVRYLAAWIMGIFE